MTYSKRFSSKFFSRLLKPAHPDNPAVFELKNPDDNIKGVVR